MTRPLLHGTPLSHFTRKIRILCAELGIDVAFVAVEGGVLAADPARFGDNPLMRVPTLVDGDTMLVESDHIARYLVARHDDARDRLGVRSERADDLNRLAVANGVMANEVVIILAERGGLPDGVDARRVVYFQKLIRAIEGGLAWLDARVPPADAPFDYRDIATICMWQHLAHYRLVELAPYTRLAAHVARHAGRASVAPSAPEVVAR
jgi:glutathione S-transferase